MEACKCIAERVAEYQVTGSTWKQVQPYPHTMNERGGKYMVQSSISYTNRICFGERDIPLEELTEEEKECFGNQLRTEPLLTMGYLLEKTAL